MSNSIISFSKYIISRILQSIPLFFGVIIFNFILIRLAPGGPAYILGGTERTLTIEFIERINREFGLDKPLHEQLFLYITNILQGDFGTSYFFREPVLSLIIERLPATGILMIMQLVISIVIGVGLAILVSRKHYSKTNSAGTVLSLVTYSIPAFWLGFVLILIFAIGIHLFPTSGMLTFGTEQTGLNWVVDLLHHLILPSLTLGLTGMAVYFGLTRDSLKDSLTQDYILTARAKGLDENKILTKHALGNSLLPVISVVGLNIGVLLAGAVLVETVFAWPGVGKLLYDALLARDMPLVLGIFIVISTTVIIANILTDIIYAIIDPRIRNS